MGGPKKTFALSRPTQGVCQMPASFREGLQNKSLGGFATLSGGADVCCNAPKDEQTPRKYAARVQAPGLQKHARQVLDLAFSESRISASSSSDRLGAGAGGGGSAFFRRLATFTSWNSTKATIRKLTTMVMKAP